MKQKATRIGLFLVVLAIWGAIWQKTSNGDAAPIEVLRITAVPQDHEEQQPKPLPGTFKFERDPFLGKGTTTRSAKKAGKSLTVQRKKVQRSSTTDESDKAIVWPVMELRGFVSPKANESASVAILLIRDREILVSKGSQVEGINVQKVGPNIVILEQQGETRTLTQE